MTELAAVLQNRLEAVIVPGYRARLLDRGLARGLIWQNGVLPLGAPSFSDSLTDDLFEYAYAVLAMALRLRSIDRNAQVLQRAFLVAGEAIEAAVHRGEPSRVDRGFHRVNAAVAFHLAGYAAQAYSMLPNGVINENLSPIEKGLVQILRRSLDQMNAGVTGWLLDDEHHDSKIAQRLRDDPNFDETDAVNIVITTSFMRGLAYFNHALTTGEEASAVEAKRCLLLTADAAGDLRAVNHWWTCKIASHLVDDLWQMSLHRQVPLMLPSDDAGTKWNSLRQNYIQRLRTNKLSTIELWPSQIEAAHRALDPTDDLVVALPTGAGKTRIAELCILRALASDQRVVYVTPLRALSAQVERDLADTFLPLGFSVSSLYGSAGIESGDANAFREEAIVVATPEKLDFAIRVDPMIINDVGLIVLDEGRMFEPNERAVRYEALVQRLLRRSDASSRRIVCLSALFPSPEQMSDFIAWLRQDEPGTAIYSTWRATRQRYGTIQWLFGVNKARLEIKVGEEKPFVPSFVEASDPPAKSKRKKPFPNSKNELTLASAWQFLSQEKKVLVYCALRKSVEKLGKDILHCIKQGVLIPFPHPDHGIQDVIKSGAEWLGPNHPALACLSLGIALHHGLLPRQYLNDVESLISSGDCPLVITSPTLGQGLNLSANVLLIPSIWRNKKLIPTPEFANVAGRAGRPYIDIEGIIFHIIYEKDNIIRHKILNNWIKIINNTYNLQITSGLLGLVSNIAERISHQNEIPIEEVIDYLTGHIDGWDYHSIEDDAAKEKIETWDNELASLDSAILSLLPVDTEANCIDDELNKELDGSLFSRQLAHEEENRQELLKNFLRIRASSIWSQSSASQRKGYYLAGVGIRAGQFMNSNAPNLVMLLLKAEAAIADNDSSGACSSIVEFAQIVFQTEPFRVTKDMPKGWENALNGWLLGRPVSKLASLCVKFDIDLLQDAFSYRLPWAMEAARTYGISVALEGAEKIIGYAAMAAEVGSVKRPVIVLLRAGLNSREAAVEAVSQTNANFVNNAGMLDWLISDQVQSNNPNENWPTIQSRYSWVQFLKRIPKSGHTQWLHGTKCIQVEWITNIPDVDTQVVIETSGIVFSPSMIRLGTLKAPLFIPSNEIIDARVSSEYGDVVIEYFSPPNESPVV